MAFDFDEQSGKNDPEFSKWVQSHRDAWIAQSSDVDAAGLAALRKRAETDPDARAAYTRAMRHITAVWWDKEGRGAWSEYEQKAPERAKQAAADKEAAERTKTINAELDEFYRKLSQPISPTDPEIQRVASMAGRSAVGQSYGSGIEGGLSVANTQAAAGAAARR